MQKFSSIVVIFFAGGVGDPVWTPITLCINMTTFRPRSNSDKWNNTSTDDGIKLILACSTSRMLGPWALFRFLTNSHIFPSGAHLTIIFTYMKMPLSPLLSCVHFIILCYPPLTIAQLVYGIVNAGAYLLLAFILPPTHQHTVNTMKMVFSGPGRLCGIMLALFDI